MQLRRKVHGIYIFSQSHIYENISIPGISVYGFSMDKYGSVGTGFVQISFGGVEIELVGRRAKDMSFGFFHQSLLEHPTRIKVANVWTQAVTNPGQYARSRLVVPSSPLYP